MLRKLTAGTLFFILCVALGYAFTQQTAIISTPAPESSIADATEALRGDIAQAMEQTTDTFGLELDLSDLLHLSQGEIVVVVAGVVGFENAAPPTSVAPVNLGLIYLSETFDVRFGDGIVGRRSPGFYAIRVSMQPSTSAHDPGITLLEILGSSESEPLSFPIELAGPATQRALTVCLEQDPETGMDAICLGWHGLGFTAQLCIQFAPVD